MFLHSNCRWCLLNWETDCRSCFYSLCTQLLQSQAELLKLQSSIMAALVLQCTLQFEANGDEPGFRAEYYTMGGPGGCRLQCAV